MAEASETAAVIPHKIGDLQDVDSAVAPSVAKSFLVWNVTNGEWEVSAPAAAEADIATADGSDPATTQALANATKVKVNALLAKLRTKGVLLP